MRCIPERGVDVHVIIPEVDDLLPEIRQVIVIHTRAAQVVEICNTPRDVIIALSSGRLSG